jgi:hypothetical protein
VIDYFIQAKRRDLMNSDQPAGQEAFELIERTIGTPLRPGELGALLSRAGVGKTACLTHIALEQLSRGKPVLHVCVDGIAEKIKIWYQELLKYGAKPSARDEITALQRKIESIRFILAYLHHTFTLEKLEQSLRNLKEQAHFFPAMIIVDGLDFEKHPRSTIQSLRDFAVSHEVSMWMSIKTHQHITIANDHGIPYPCHDSDDMLHSILFLEPSPKAIRVRVLKHGDRYQVETPEVMLNPQNYLLLKG